MSYDENEVLRIIIINHPVFLGILNFSGRNPHYQSDRRFRKRGLQLFLRPRKLFEHVLRQVLLGLDPPCRRSLRGRDRIYDLLRPERAAPSPGGSTTDSDGYLVLRHQLLPHYRGQLRHLQCDQISPEV